jgi:hypothetical protein
VEAEKVSGFAGLTYQHHKLSSYDPFISSHSILRPPSGHFPRGSFIEIKLT